MEKGKSFIIYADYKDSFGLLSGEQCKELLMALFELHETGKTTDFSDGMVKMAFLQMSKQMLRDKEKYDEVCKKRSEYGRKGGLARCGESKQTKAKASKSKQKQANEADNDNVNVNDNETDNDNDNVIVNETDNDTERNEALPDCSTQTHEKEVPQQYGQYGHVQLTEEQHRKLEAEYGRDLTAEYIRRIDEWSQLTGKTYLDYYLAVINWIKKDERDKSSTGCRDDDFDVEKYKQFINCF